MYFGPVLFIAQKLNKIKCFYVFFRSPSAIRKLNDDRGYRDRKSSKTKVSYVRHENNLFVDKKHLIYFYFCPKH